MAGLDDTAFHGGVVGVDMEVLDMTTERWYRKIHEFMLRCTFRTFDRLFAKLSLRRDRDDWWPNDCGGEG